MDQEKFHGIGEYFGYLHRHGHVFFGMGEMVVAQILVSLDIREGLVEYLEIVSRGKAHK
jgi:hypothetical protein